VFGKLAVFEFIPATGMGACCFTVTFDREIKLFAKLTHPTNLPGGHAHHEGVRGNIFVNHRTGSDESVLANGNATYNGAVGAQCCALFHERISVFALAFDQRTGIVNVGEDHTRATEYALFQVDVVVNRDVVLDFAVIGDGDSIAHEHILAHGDVFSDSGTAAYVDEMPHPGAFADLSAFIYNGAGVDLYRHFSHLYLTHVKTGAAPKESAPVEDSDLYVLFLQERMIIASQTGRSCVANGGNGVDRNPIFLKAETITFEDFFVAASMEVGKAAGEFDFLTIHGD